MDLAKKFREARQQFPMMHKSVHGHPLIYLDSAATAQKPRAVIDAMSRFYAEEYATVHRAVYTTAAAATEAYEGARKLIQQFLGASSEKEIIFCRGATEAINMVASSYGKLVLSPGDEILITHMEHHSNIVPWQLATCERGAKLVIAPVLDSGEIDMNALSSLLNSRTKIVAFPHMSNVLGTINPVQEVVRQAHAVGAKVVLDAAQSAPHLPINVQELGVDFLVFSGHKAVGPTGIGVLYGKEELLAAMPPFQGGGDMIETVTFEKTTYNALPLKFEAGTPSIAEVIGLGAAIDFLMCLGMKEIALWEHELLQHLLPRMQKIDSVRLLGASPSRGPLITFAVERVHPLDIATLLDLEGIAIRSGHLCAQPILQRFGLTTAARASLAFYNTKEELDHFLEALQRILPRLR